MSVVIACNTATAAAAATLRARFEIPIIGMEPAVKPAVAATRSGVVGVLATVGTLESAKFAALLEQYAGEVEIVAQACPGLVEQVEAGELDGSKTRALLERYTAPLLARGADTLVLGCTHYAFLRPQIAELVGPAVTLIDTGDAVAKQVVRRLPATAAARRHDSGGAFLDDGRSHGRAPDRRPALGRRGLRYRAVVATARSRRSLIAAFGCAPTIRSTSRPPTITSIVGMLRTSKRLAVAGFSSTLSLATRMRPASSAASCSIAGAIARHGPHHGAQASTSTGSGERSTSAANVASVTVNGVAAAVAGNGCLQRPQRGRAPSASFAAGTLFVAPQLPQAISMGSDMGTSVSGASRWGLAG